MKMEVIQSWRIVIGRGTPGAFGGLPPSISYFLACCGVASFLIELLLRIIQFLLVADWFILAADFG
jgi:hypothetical protein